MILAVALDAPLRRLFDYRAPANTDPAALQPGLRVWVPFGRRRALGVLVETRTRSAIPDRKLRTAHEVLDHEPVFDPDLLHLLLWAADYYQHPVGEVLAAAMPASLRRGAALELTEIRWHLAPGIASEALAGMPVRATRMRAVLEALRAADPEAGLDAAALDEAAPGWRNAIGPLAARGLVVTRERAVHVPLPGGPCLAGPEPGPAQRAAIRRIEDSLDRFTTFLLDGVTGSGKTEVYLRAIETVLARGAQALVLVPEIALTPQLTRRFAERFAVPLAVLHSSVSDAQRAAAWRAAREGTAGIVIGTRSAIFTPLHRPGLIVVDEEHDPSYKQQEGFRYSARDLAIVRAQRHGIPVVLGSATPSLESLARLRRQDPGSAGGHLLLPDRAGTARPPSLDVIDMKRHGATHGLSTPAMLAMHRHLEAGAQVLLYLNRRGYAPVLFCPECGWSAPCPRCDARLTLHRRAGRLMCHHCGLEQSVPSACPRCHAGVKPVGQGTERIEDALSQLFPGVPALRIDRDSIRRKGDLDTAMDRIHGGEVRILVGTQMLTKGHHFPDVSLVVVLDADQGLFSTDFRASERLAQSIVQVAGRAGRAARPGEVLIQTEYPGHPLLQQLIAGGYPAFAAAALQERERAGWPPFARLALLRADATAEASPLRFLAAARAAAPPRSDVSLLGPAPAPMQRRDNRFHAQLLLHARSAQALRRLLNAWIPSLEALPEARRVRWSVDVDPLELF